MTTDGLPERPEFESQSTERILRRISEAILVSADTTRKVEEGAAFASRQDFVDSQVSLPDVPSLNDPFGDVVAPPPDSVLDVAAEPQGQIAQDAVPDAAVAPPNGGIPVPDNMPEGGIPLPGADDEDRQDDAKPDFAMLAQAPPLPDSLDPMIAGALQFQDLEFAGNEDDREAVPDADPDAPESPPPDFPKPQANQPQWNADDFTTFTFEGVESSFSGRRANRQPPPPVDMPEDPMQVGEQTTLFHEDDSTILQMVQQYREVDRQFRKGVMDIFEMIIMDLHADNARLMSLVRHFQLSRRSTR